MYRSSDICFAVKDLDLYFRDFRSGKDRKGFSKKQYEVAKKEKRKANQSLEYCNLFYFNYKKNNPVS